VKGGEDNVSAPSLSIAKAHNELYAFYTGKGYLLKNAKASTAAFECASAC